MSARMKERARLHHNATLRECGCIQCMPPIEVIPDTKPIKKALRVKQARGPLKSDVNIERYNVINVKLIKVPRNKK